MSRGEMIVIVCPRDTSFLQFDGDCVSKVEETAYQKA